MDKWKNYFAQVEKAAEDRCDPVGRLAVHKLISFVRDTDGYGDPHELAWMALHELADRMGIPRP